VWVKGRGELALCGPKRGKWTQVGEMMNGVIMSGQGGYMRIREWDHATKIRVSHEIPSVNPNG